MSERMRSLLGSVRPGHHMVMMVRHGQSLWNAKNLFAGWYDTKLSPLGRKEAELAGATLSDLDYRCDVAYCSILTRSEETLNIMLRKLRNPKRPRVISSWRLNERHYGALTGLDKSDTARQYGEEQVKIWRRSYDVPPPPMEEGHPYYSSIVNDARYKRTLRKDDFPKGESLKMTVERTQPFWMSAIMPMISAGKRVLLVAHGNSLRGIIKGLDNLTDDEIMMVNLPTAVPFLYILDDDMKPIPGGSMKFLGDSETVRKAYASVNIKPSIK